MSSQKVDPSQTHPGLEGSWAFWAIEPTSFTLYPVNTFYTTQSTMTARCIKGAP
jgi:hypothetical protein